MGLGDTKFLHCLVCYCICFSFLGAGSSSDIGAQGLCSWLKSKTCLGTFNHLIMEILAYLFSSSTLFFFKERKQATLESLQQQPVEQLL